MNELFPPNEFCRDNQAILLAAVTAIGERIDNDPDHVVVRQQAGRLAVVSGLMTPERWLASQDIFDEPVSPEEAGERAADFNERLLEEAQGSIKDTTDVLGELLARSLGGKSRGVMAVAADRCIKLVQSSEAAYSSSTFEARSDEELETSEELDASEDLGPDIDHDHASRVVTNHTGVFDSAAFHRLRLKEAGSLHSFSFTTVDGEVVSTASSSQPSLSVGIYMMAQHFFDVVNNDDLIALMAGYFKDEAELDARLNTHAAGQANRLAVPRLLTQLRAHCLNAKAGRETAETLGMNGPDLSLLMRLPRLIS